MAGCLQASLYPEMNFHTQFKNVSKFDLFVPGCDVFTHVFLPGLYVGLWADTCLNA
jgi:hypothetical protein